MQLFDTEIAILSPDDTPNIEWFCAVRRQLSQELRAGRFAPAKYEQQLMTTRGRNAL